jgi:two-component system, chemotaxis family, protein-glutamate methylesterase/glutaminase
VSGRGFERVVVIGASAGGVTALRTVVGALPRDFPAPILVVQHIGNRASILPELLSRSGPLPAAHAEDNEPLVAGRIYVAPPDVHLTLLEDRVRLHAGPKENHTRPAIDPLFRSAALAFGTRAIAVVLTGGLDDGTSGLQAIKMCGGVAIVQDPSTAEDPSMPRSALAYVKVDHCVPVQALAPLLVSLSRQAVAPEPPPQPPELVFEHHFPDMKGDPMENLKAIAAPSGFVCPDCKGSLWKVHDAQPPRYRCYTGHVYTLKSLRQAQEEGVDSALWNALRALEEKHNILKEMAAEEPRGGDPKQLLAAAAEALDLAHRLRALIQVPDKADEAAE